MERLISDCPLWHLYSLPRLSITFTSQHTRRLMWLPSPKQSSRQNKEQWTKKAWDDMNNHEEKEWKGRRRPLFVQRNCSNSFFFFERLEILKEEKNWIDNFRIWGLKMRKRGLGKISRWQWLNRKKGGKPISIFPPFFKCFSCFSISYFLYLFFVLYTVYY